MPPLPWKTLHGSAPKVIAHRGASGELPEHTLQAYALAIAQGADLIEPDLVPTRDGVLVARHDRGLARSTDVASVPEFAGRARTMPDGTRDWAIEDFDWDELGRLRAIQPWPTRDRSHDGRYAIPRLEQVLDLAVRESQQRGRVIGVYPELKHPADFATAGIDVTKVLIELLRARGLQGPASPVWFQCFEAEPLRRVHEALSLPTFALYEQSACADEDLLEKVARQQHAALTGIAVPKSVPVARADFVAQVHERGWQLHTWTYRDDVPLPGATDARAELSQAYGMGIDAVFADFPDTAIASRDCTATPSRR